MNGSESLSPSESPGSPASPTSGVPLILLAGLGADKRQWRPQVEAFPDAVAPDWLPFQAGESLAAYAARFGATLPIGPQTVIAGSSFGGMLALEMARQATIKPKCAVLIGSSRDRSATNPLLRLLERVCRVVPDGLIEAGKGIGALFLGRGGSIPPADRALLIGAARDLPVVFLRRAARSIITWPGCPDPGVPVRHIHGTSDWVVFPGRVRADVMVPRGAHVLNLSHPEEVNRFLGMCMES